MGRGQDSLNSSKWHDNESLAYVPQFVSYWGLFGMADCFHVQQKKNSLTDT
jgi:hypothetical protein